MKKSIAAAVAPVTSVLSSGLAVFCPLCIPALGAILASLGLGFALNFEFLKCALIILLIISVSSLAFSVRVHKRWSVFLVGSIGAALIYAGRYTWYNPVLMVFGTISLMGASFWNLKIKMRCNRCLTNSTTEAKKDA